MGAMVRTQIYLPRELHEELKRRAEEDGVPMAVQIRDALRLYLERTGSEGRVLREDDPIWSFVGTSDGPVDASTDHDKYLYGRRSTGEPERDRAKDQS